MSARTARGPMDPPAPFFVEFENGEKFREVEAKHGHDWATANPDAFMEELDFETEIGARSYAKVAEGATAFRRINIVDDTPPGIHHRKVWDWDAEALT